MPGRAVVTTGVVGLLAIAGATAAAAPARSLRPMEPARRPSRRVTDDRDGVTPWDFTLRQDLREEYTAQPGGTVQNQVILRLEGSPGAHNTGYRLDLPFLTTDSSGPTGSGVGDVLVQGVTAFQRTRTFAWGGGARLLFPTATGEPFGAGKYQAGPAAGFLWREGKVSVALLAVNPISYAGDPQRQRVNELELQPFLTWYLPRRWWLQSAPILKRNWVDRTWTVPLALEVGRRFTHRYAAAGELQLPLAGKPAIVAEFTLKLRYFFE